MEVQDLAISLKFNFEALLRKEMVHCYSTKEKRQNAKFSNICPASVDILSIK